MFDRLARIEERYEELSRLMADPEVAQDHERIARLAREQADLEETVQTYRRWRDLNR